MRRDWRNSAAAGLFLVAFGLASIDLLEIVPAFASVVSSPIFPFIHEPHDILSVLLGIYCSYRWGTRWGALFLVMFFVAHAPYAYVRIRDMAGLTELARLAVVGGVATFGVLISGELSRTNAILRERNVRLNALITIADSLGRPDSLEKKCSAIAEQLAIIAEADRVLFRVPDDGHKSLRIVGIFETGALGADKHAPIPYGEGLVGRAYVERSIKVSNDYAYAPDALPEMVARGVRSYLAVPILSGTHVLAVAGLASKERDHFDSGRVRLIEALVEQLEPMLEHSRLLTALGAAEILLHLVSAAVRHTGDGVAITREDGTFVYVNPALENMTGYSAKELIGQNPRILKSGVQDQAFYQRLWNTILSGETFRAEMVNKKKTGELYSAEKTITPLRNEQGSITHFVVIDRDITDRKQAEAALRASEERFSKAFLTSPTGIILTNLSDNQIVAANDSALRMMGYASEEVIGRKPQDVPMWVRPEDYMEMVQTLRGKGSFSGLEASIRRKSGDEAWGLWSASLVDMSGPHLLVQVQDITERKQAEEQLKKYAFTDVLTDLPNRAVLMDRLEQALERVKRKMTTGVALLYMDLDRFKNVNDSMGHVVGDDLLKAVGQRLQARMRAVDTVARLGGDEFAVLLEGMGDVAAALFVVERVRGAFASPFEVAGHEIAISASVGIVHTTTGTELARDLLHDADTAMYRAKSEGGARAVVFDTGMHARAVTIMRTEAQLQRALRQQEFRLHYQPIVSLSTGRMTGCEALIRWQHPEQGLLAPDAFLQIADDTGLIVPMGQWVLHAVCAQIRAWRDAGLDVPRISINLSARRFGQKGLLEEVVAALDDYALAAKDVALEIVESSATRDVEDTAARLQGLASFGVRVVMDDFGTGYSSLGLLQRLPLHGIKIAQTFVEGLPADARDTAIARAIIEMAHSLRLNVVAEGVENEEQMAFLRAAQCDEIQGYLVSRPVPSEEFVHLIRKGQLL